MRQTGADRAAIVTGASRGIGLALAETLGAEGYGLTISARRADTLERAAERLRDNGHEVECVAGEPRGRRRDRRTSSHVIESGSGASTSS